MFTFIKLRIKPYISLYFLYFIISTVSYAEETPINSDKSSGEFLFKGQHIKLSNNIGSVLDSNKTEAYLQYKCFWPEASESEENNWLIVYQSAGPDDHWVSFVNVNSTDEEFKYNKTENRFIVGQQKIPDDENSKQGFFDNKENRQKKTQELIEQYCDDYKNYNKSNDVTLISTTEAKTSYKGTNTLCFVDKKHKKNHTLCPKLVEDTENHATPVKIDNETNNDLSESKSETSVSNTKGGDESTVTKVPSSNGKMSHENSASSRNTDQTTKTAKDVASSDSDNLDNNSSKNSNGIVIDNKSKSGLNYTNSLPNNITIDTAISNFFNSYKADIINISIITLLLIILLITYITLKRVSANNKKTNEPQADNDCNAGENKVLLLENNDRALTIPLEQHKTEITNLKQQLDDITKKNDTINADTQELLTCINSYIAKQHTTQHLAGNIDSATTEVLHTRNNQQIEDLASATDWVKRIIADKEKITEQQQDSKKRITELEQSKIDKEKELSNKVNRLTEDNKQLEDKNNVLNQDLATSKENANTITTSYRVLKIEKSEAIKSKQHLEKELEKVEAEATKLLDEKQNLTDINSTLETKNKTLEAEVQKEKEEAEELSTEIQNISKTIDNLTSEKQTLLLAEENLKNNFKQTKNALEKALETYGDQQLLRSKPFLNALRFIDDTQDFSDKENIENLGKAISITASYIFNNPGFVALNELNKELIDFFFAATSFVHYHGGWVNIKLLSTPEQCGRLTADDLEKLISYLGLTPNVKPLLISYIIKQMALHRVYLHSLDVDDVILQNLAEIKTLREYGRFIDSCSLINSKTNIITRTLAVALEYDQFSSQKSERYDSI